MILKEDSNHKESVPNRIRQQIVLFFLRLRTNINNIFASNQESSKDKNADFSLNTSDSLSDEINPINSKIDEDHQCTLERHGTFFKYRNDSHLVDSHLVDLPITPTYCPHYTGPNPFSEQYKLRKIDAFNAKTDDKLMQLAISYCEETYVDLGLKIDAFSLFNSLKDEKFKYKKFMDEELPNTPNTFDMNSID